MKLTEVAENIEQIDDDLIIFIEDINDLNSDVILSRADGRIGGPENINGVLYNYLLEIFIAKEIIEDYCKDRSAFPSAVEKAKEIHKYAINDA